jgi:hypothetical protein
MKDTKIRVARLLDNRELARLAFRVGGLVGIVPSAYKLFTHPRCSVRPPDAATDGN